MTDATGPSARALSCPSASADDPRARIFGIVHGDAEAPRVTYLERPVRVTAELLAQLDGVSPGEVFRVVSPCAEQGCRHFAEGACGIAKQVSELDAVTGALPPCTIRATCRWYGEHGAKACVRCPQVVTLTLVSRSEERARRRLPLL